MEGLENFKYHLIRKGKRQITVEKHLNSLSYLFVKCNPFNIDTVERFLFSLYEKGRSPNYLNNYIAALHLYGDFCQDESFDKIKYFRLVETHKGTLSDDEIEQFLKLRPEQLGVLKKGLFEQFTIFFTILSYTGMRPNEVVKLSTRQVDFGSGCIQLFSDTKTATPRTVPLNPMLIPVLTNYIKALDSDRLFPDWDRHDWKRQFNTRIKFLGIKRDKLSTYSLRHSLITRLIEEDVALQKVMKIVGHKRIETTFHYTHLTKRDVIKAIKKDRLGRKLLTKTERLLQGRRVLEDLGFIVTVAKLSTTGFLFEAFED